MSNDIPAHSVAVHDLKEVFKVCKVKEKLKSLFKPAKTRVEVINMCRWDFVLGYKIEEIQFNADIP